MNHNYKRVVKNFYPKAILLVFLFFAVSCSFGQSLSGIPGLALWLAADSGVVVNGPGDSVALWHDLSGGGNDAVATPGNEPVRVIAPTLNNKPALLFNGATDFFSGPQIAAFNNNGSSCGTYIFMVSKSNGAQVSGSTGLFTIGAQLYGLLWERNTNLGELFVSNQTPANGAQDYIYTSAMTNSAFPYKLFEVRKTEGVNVALYANTTASPLQGFPTNAGLVNSFTNSTYNIGWAQGTTNYLNGEIAELIVFTGTCLTGPQIAQVESYLDHKYSPSLLSVHDTVSTHNLCAITLTAASGYTSYHWSTGATSQTIAVAKTGTYFVSATDMFSIQHMDSVHVTLPSYSLDSSAILCQGGAIELVPHMPSFSNYTFNWSSGQTTDSISVTVAGNYKVTITDAIAHCSDTTNTEVVTVDAFRGTVSLGSAVTLCSGNRISLTSPTTGWSNLHFAWSNGSIDSLLTVTTTGPYSVTVTNTNGCSGSASVNVTIAGTAPHVNFSSTPVCLGTALVFTNLSDNGTLNYLWSFGDGTGTSTLRSPSYTYHTPGTFYVKLTVSNPATGCSNDTTLPVVINALPAAAFQSGVTCDSVQFQFNDLSIPVIGQSINSWSWQFGDLLSGTSTQQNPYYTYTAIDTYQVSLTVTQANGCASTVTNSFIVQLPSAAPTAPVLEYPLNGSVAPTSTVTFGWAASTGASYYDLIVSPDPSFSIDNITYNNIYSNQKTVYLPPNQTYYWRVTAINPCGFIAYSLVDTVSVFNPGNLGNLAFWLKADSGVVSSGGKVSLWKDISGNVGADATQSTTANQPSVISQVPLLNRMPSIFFNSTTSLMTGNAIPSLGASGSSNQNSLSIFIVARASGPATSEPGGIFTIGQLNTGMWIERHPAFGYTYINNFSADADGGAAVMADTGSMPAHACPYHIYGIMKNLGSNVVMDTNSIFCKSTTDRLQSGSFTNDVYNLGHPAGTDPYGGNAPYGYLNGEIAEVIVYNTLLTPQQKTLVDQYLFNKYAPPVNLGPDIVQAYRLCPVTLKTGSRFVSYRWSTGQTSDTINVTQSGTYWVSAVDVFNRTSSDTIHVTLPYHGSNPDTDFICFGDTGRIIQLIDQPTLYTYQWFDSTSPSSVVNLNINADTIHPVTSGYYYTKIKDNGGCSITSHKIPVIIDNFYSANLIPAYDTICRNGTLIINTVPYTIDSFLWQPTGDTASAPTISSSGTYYLYTVDNHGCRNLDSSQITTRAQAPVVNFTVPNYCLSNSTYFIDSSFAAPGDSIISYYWNYGGGIPSTDTTVNGKTSYRINYGYGNYTVTLKVTTDSGCYGYKTRHITLLPSPNAGYSDSANNSVYPYILCAGSGSTAQFTDTSEVVGGSPIVQRFWKFNGVASANSASTIQYSFPTQGIYDITLEVVNALGCADSITQRINVNPPFVAQFTYSDQCLGDYTSFTDNTQSLSIVRRVWKFRENGDGPYAYNQNARIQFSQPNTYDVELQVQNAIGCISTLDQLVKIAEKPVANFTGLIACQNHYYTPLDSSVSFNDNLVSWNWNIGGTITNVRYPRVLFADTGTLNVSLIVTSQLGCVDSITKLIQVGPVPTALFAFSPLYGTAPLAVTFSNRSTGSSSYTWNFGDGTSVGTVEPYINPAPHTYAQNGNYDVALYAYNNYGCFDSLVRTINVIPTDLDIAIDLVTTSAVTQTNGSELVTVVAYISNLGTRVITSTQLYALLGGTGILEQNWSGYLTSGQTIIDTFPAQFVVDAGSTNTYVCVTATNVNGGETETDTTNNQNCASLTSSMQLAGPQPNPAITNSKLGIILPQAGTVYISILDQLGRPVVPEFSLSLPVGRSNYNIPVGMLQGAEYFIRVRYNDDIEVRKFVVR